MSRCACVCSRSTSFPPQIPLTADEEAFTAALQTQEEAWGGDPMAFLTPRNASLSPYAQPETPPQPASTERATKGTLRLLARLGAEYVELTAAHPGLAVVIYSPRAGASAVRAAEFGVDSPLRPTLVLCAAADSAADSVMATAAAIADSYGYATTEAGRQGAGRVFGGALTVVHLNGTDAEAVPLAVGAAWEAAGRAARLRDGLGWLWSRVESLPGLGAVARAMSSLLEPQAHGPPSQPGSTGAGRSDTGQGHATGSHRDL